MPWNAISNLITGTINTAVEGAQAAKNLEWQKEMFQRQQDFEVERAEDAQAFEKEENELAFQREKEMWNMQNAYNSPKEQMRRYQDAGLSPYLIYGQGTPGNATESPKYSPTHATKPKTLTPPQLPTFKSSLPTNLNVLEGYQTMSNVRVNNANENLAKQQANKVASETERVNIDNKTQSMKNLLELKYQMLEIQLKKGHITEKDLQNEYRSFENKLFKDTYDIQVDSYKAGLNKTKEETKNIQANTAYTELKGFIDSQMANVDMSVKRKMIAQYDANINKIESEVELNKKNKKILEEQLGKVKAEKLLTQFEYKLKKDAYEDYNPYIATELFKYLKAGLDITNTASNLVDSVIPF